MVVLQAFVLVWFFFVSYAQGKSNYKSHAEAGLKTLQKWYNTTTGLWETTGWWNGGNCLTTIADFAIFDEQAASVGHTVFLTTFAKAQKANFRFHKRILPNGLVDTNYLKPSSDGSQLQNRGNPGFINDYYDDEGWWALGWVQVYDLTGDPKYLNMAEDIFEDMTRGWDDSRCGGGIWWDKNQTALVAIANELFLSVAAHLATRVHHKANHYHSWATKGWYWFKKTGMINERNNINDGIDLKTCQNNRGIVWSYNQGVILGALVELSRASPIPDYSFIAQAHTIAFAAINTLADEKGILHDPCEPDCGADGPQFKGIFMRNLQILHKVAPRVEYQIFIEENARSIWQNAKNEKDQFGVNWVGPFAGPALASTQSSALDALVAAAAIRR
ncbi:glycosyl hydrolase [Histoplasma capsulatum G186AR]|uniref:Glycosyl hydrolase n=1 Tax=Ajellomyces capsulatus TaxID=5037 RepID=A0A8H7Z2P1_AJECA|nr:glycosyl hydrolase [Histoplasma capsulatum]QSS71561.1 glycosyl hydrolase [Histoplasma capsulatum G186AR]